MATTNNKKLYSIDLKIEKKTKWTKSTLLTGVRKNGQNLLVGPCTAKIEKCFKRAKVGETLKLIGRYDQNTKTPKSVFWALLEKQLPRYASA